MMMFLGTLLITMLCCLGLGIGVLLRGRPLTGGCGEKPPGVARCDGCPNREDASQRDGKQ